MSGSRLTTGRCFTRVPTVLCSTSKPMRTRERFVTVACDGSAIYPSRILGASPKHDSGTFFSNGQDPIRKDVLEMLFRMFEREGLVLVPTLAMSGPLPVVEESRILSGEGGQFEMVSYQPVTRIHHAQKRTAHLQPVKSPSPKNGHRCCRRDCRAISFLRILSGLGNCLSAGHLYVVTGSPVGIRCGNDATVLAITIRLGTSLGCSGTKFNRFF